MNNSSAWLTAVSLAFTFGVAAADAPRLPDPATGELNGRVAVMVWPADPSGAGEPRLRSPAGCTVHMFSIETRRETLYDCGEWFQPDRGRYIHWLEQGARVSQQTVMRYGGEDFRGRGMIVVKPLAPAARVQLDAQARVGANETFRVVSLSEPEATRLFTRRFTTQEARTVATVPAGPLLGGIFDAAGDAVSLARVVKAEAGSSHTLSPRLPKAATSDVLVLVNRPRSHAACRPKLSLGKGTRPPDVNFQSVQRLVFVWYDVPTADRAMVTVDCDNGRVEKPIRLAPRRVVTVRHEFENAPKEGGTP